MGNIIIKLTLSVQFILHSKSCVTDTKGVFHLIDPFGELRQMWMNGDELIPIRLNGRKLITTHPYSPFIKHALFSSTIKVRSLRFSRISVIPAWSASSSILNLDNSWSSFRRYLSTYNKHLAMDILPMGNVTNNEVNVWQSGPKIKSSIFLDCPFFLDPSTWNAQQSVEHNSTHWDH